MRKEEGHDLEQMFYTIHLSGRDDARGEGG
jgi:hypothetical protein